MGKRGSGEGTITRHKNGSWAAQYTVYTAEGRKRETLYGVKPARRWPRSWLRHSRIERAGSPSMPAVLR